MSRTGKKIRKTGDLSDGASDKLEPLASLDLSSIHTISDLVYAMGKCSFGARSVGEAAEVVQDMVEDEDCFKVLTLSGAMTPAKMGLIVCDMIDRGMTDAVVTTGAIMAHGMVESTGRAHFKHSEFMNDVQLYHKGYNRIYDTIELERSLDDMELIFRDVMEKATGESESLGSYALNWLIGKHLAENTTKDQRGILKSAYLKKVPVYVPSFTDSELGLDFGVYMRRMKLAGKTPIRYDAFADLEDYTDRVLASKKLGILTIGGGVPRNWAQQVGPYLDIINKRVGSGGGFKRFDYAVRICPEPVHWGGLSGCTYSEGVSWGKIVPRSEGGRYAEVFSDATIAWPLIIKAVMERLSR
ncbi:MAG: deoxyhypusine synthase family protein [Candidatus Thermoplasmatota archaeon]|nr:deoxyhypusine synthase family protein [Candidatus Thermoplasmatota archaeon]